MAKGSMRLLLGGAALTGIAAAILVWRAASGEAPKSPSPRPGAAAAPGRDSERSRPEGYLSDAANSAGAAAAADLEQSTLALAPSGDFEIAVSDAELEAIVEARYGPLVRALALPPPARARLVELLTERQHASIDVANAAMVAGLNPIRDLPLIQRAIALAEADVDADIAREHGAAVAAACRDFEATRAERNTVDQLARALADIGEPLTSAQQRRLVQVLAASEPSGTPDINSAIFGHFNRPKPLGPRILAAAAGEISPRQLDFLRQMAQSAPAARKPAN
jgi:hypothetical protein